MTDNEDIQGQTGEEIRMPDITYKPGYNKLDSFNWLKDLPDNPDWNDIVEIRFKNTRKGFFRNVNGLRLEIGDVVAVEASPGHDIGRVSMVGHLVDEQLKKLKTHPSPDDLKKVYRKAKAVDIQKWEESKKLETPTMLRSRKISEELKLNMKIGDVEYQGDKTKAIFYYIADERVDFRQLIKVLADEFRVRIEMRQIGATAGSRKNRRNRFMRKRTMLCNTYHKFYFSYNNSCKIPGAIAESAETCRTVQ